MPSSSVNWPSSRHGTCPPRGRTSPSVATAGAPCLYDVATGKRLDDFDTGGHKLQEFVLSRDGSLLAGIGDGKIRLWDLKTGKKVREFRGGGVSPVFSLDGKLMATMGDAGGSGEVVYGRNEPGVAHFQRMVSAAVSPLPDPPPTSPLPGAARR